MMFKHMKVVTSLILVLVFFCFLQLTAGGLFFHSLKGVKDNFAVSQTLRQQQTDLNDTFNALVQTRTAMSLAAHRFMLDMDRKGAGNSVNEFLAVAQRQLDLAEKSYQRWDSSLSELSKNSDEAREMEKGYVALHDALAELHQFIIVGKLSDYYAQPTQAFLDAFTGSYTAWQQKRDALMAAGAEENLHAWHRSIWTLGGMLVVALLMSFGVWLGTHHILLRPLRTSIDHISAIASGDLTRQITVDGHNEMAQLAARLQYMQSELVRTVGAVRDGSDAILTGASEIAAGNNELSSRTEQQAAALGQTAASMEQLTATVKQNAENACQASQLALSASQTALKGGKVVDSVVKTMNEIAGSSKKIADITGVIDSIAFQTNILSLNAAVEAARAGEQGRGFAVVAGEVRSLAQRSAQAAKEIKELIEDSVERVDTGSVLVESAGETMNDIVNSVTRVTDIMGEIASASEEQSRGIDQVGAAVSEMDRVTQQNAALVEESASAAASLEEQAGRLTQSVAAFSIRLPHNAADAVVKRPAATAEPAAPANDDRHWETF
ncbi:Tsr, subunit of methyl-accepting chemotaxis protein I [Erwinia sp. Ejp617]|nr:Tsr, subunit of methyl-accepting chemotaxis protein I [Erwinia sp. Ejp617]